MNPAADSAYRPLADCFVGCRLKDLSVFVLQEVGGGRRAAGGLEESRPNWTHGLRFVRVGVERRVPTNS